MNKCHDPVNVSPVLSAKYSRRSKQRVALVCLGLLSGCFTYTPLVGLRPQPGQRVTFTISDQGRLALAQQVGSGVTSLEGTMVADGDGTYLVNVYEVKAIAGNSHWTGERVTVRAEHVTGMSIRRFSKGRTALAIVGTAASIGAFIITRNLLGFGSPQGDPTNPPPPES